MLCRKCTTSRRENKKYKKEIMRFLSSMYPTENMSKKTDVDIIEYMVELQEIYKKYKNEF